MEPKIYEPEILSLGVSHERFTDTIEFTPISNDRMVCANCSHCTKDILSCNIFQQKHDSVFDGENCKYFEAR